MKPKCLRWTCESEAAHFYATYILGDPIIFTRCDEHHETGEWEEIKFEEWLCHKLLIA